MSFIFPPNSKMYLDFTNGIIGIGTTTPSANLHVQGNLTVTGTTNLSSISFGSGITGTLNTATQPNITSIGTLTGLTVTGTGITGTLNTATQPNITSIGTLTGLTVTGTGITGTLNTATQNNITSVGTLTGLTVTGTGITGTLNTATQNSITSIGTLTGLTVTGTGITGTLNTATQPNITSVGTLTSLSVAGSGMTVLANGNVGMGITIPVANLHVVGPVNLISATGSTGLYMRLGNVGIGTATPNANLHVLGFSQLLGSTGTTGLYVSSAGNIGIGTSSPQANLHIHNPSNVSTLIISSLGGSHQNSPDSTNNNQLIIRSVGSNLNTSTGTFPSSPYSLGIGVDGSVGVNGMAYLNYAGNGQSAATLGLQTRGGSVGIGTTNSNYTLDVNGTINCSGIRINTRGPLKFDYGTYTTGTIAVGGVSTGIGVTFSITFSSAPIVVSTCQSPWGQYACSDAETISTTGFTGYVAVMSTSGGGSRTYTIGWIAIGL